MRKILFLIFQELFLRIFKPFQRTRRPRQYHITRHMFTCDLYSHAFNIIIHLSKLSSFSLFAMPGNALITKRVPVGTGVFQFFTRIPNSNGRRGEGVSGFRLQTPLHFRIFEHWTLTSVTLRRHETHHIFYLIIIGDKGTTGWYSGAQIRRSPCPEG